MRVVGLIGWLGNPATGHLPFLGGGGGCSAILGQVRLAKGDPAPLDLPRHRSPDCPAWFFRAPTLLVGDLKFVKWLAVDAAELSR